MKMEWIDVEDKKPEEGKAVLVSLTNSVVTVAYRTKEKGINVWQLFGDMHNIFDLKNEQVTHWMSLPSSAL